MNTSHRDGIYLSDIVSIGNELSELQEKKTNGIVRYGEVFSVRQLRIHPRITDTRKLNSSIITHKLDAPTRQSAVPS